MIAHGLLALALAPAHDTYAVAAGGAAVLIALFFATLHIAADRAPTRYAASLSLGGFAVLHAFQLHGYIALWFLPYTCLLLLVWYEDPGCLWAGVAIVGTALLIAPEFEITLFSGAETAPPWGGRLADFALYLAGAGAATAGALFLRRQTLRTASRQQALAAENLRLSAELEQARATATPKEARPTWSAASTAGARERERQWYLAAESAPDAIAVIDLSDGHIIDVNTKALELTGRTLREIVGREHTVLYPTGQVAFIRTSFRQAAAGHAHPVEAELLHRDGQTTPVEVAFAQAQTTHGAAMVAVFRDTTERKRAEARRAAFSARHQELQRLESLHAMAAGIAHDFNNILMTILGFASVGRERCAGSTTAQTYFEQIERATLRAGDVCRQMLTFAGRAQVALRSADLNEAMRALEPTLRAQLHPQIELALTLLPNLPQACFDSTSLAKVIGILVHNAVEAIGEKPGLIQLQTRLIGPEDPLREEDFLSPYLTADPYLVVEIHDTGCGIAPTVLHRVFEPFYSTKFIGRGLGLSEALGIVRAQRGAIQVKSVLGEGSTFRIYLPAAPCPSKIPLIRRPSPPENPSERTRNVALVIEDETVVCEVVGGMIEELGFAVHRAGNGTDGLELFARFGSQVAVVLLDLSMPGLPSHRVLEVVRQSQHDARVLMMSGYSEQDVIARCGRYQPDGFLPKPFSRSELKRAIFGAGNIASRPDR